VAVITEITQAVVSELNGGAFSLAFTAERAYLPCFDLQEMQSLHVTVVARSVSQSKLDRGRCQKEIEIDIAVQKRVAGETEAELDPLMDLVQEIGDYLSGRELGGVPNAIWVKTVNEPIFAQEHLSEMRQFTSLLTVTYRVVG